MYLISNVEQTQNFSISKKYNFTTQDCFIQYNILSCHIEKLQILMDFQDTINEIYTIFQYLFSSVYTTSLENSVIFYFNETLFNFQSIEKIYPYNLSLPPR